MGTNNIAFAYNTLGRSVSANISQGHPDGNPYSLTLRTGATTGLSAGDTLLSFRTGTGAGVWLVTQMRMSTTQLVAFGAVKVIPIEVYIARSFTASDSGGIAATLTSTSGRQRSADVNTTISDFRVANTATLTAGTRTVDAVPIGVILLATTTTLGASLGNGTVLLTGGLASMALPVLVANEGIIVSPQLAYAATGTLNIVFEIEYTELPGW